MHFGRVDAGHAARFTVVDLWRMGALAATYVLESFGTQNHNMIRPNLSHATATTSTTRRSGYPPQTNQLTTYQTNFIPGENK